LSTENEHSVFGFTHAWAPDRYPSQLRDGRVARDVAAARVATPNGRQMFGRAPRPV